MFYIEVCRRLDSNRCWKRPLYQLNHNSCHCLIFNKSINWWTVMVVWQLVELSSVADPILVTLKFYVLQKMTETRVKEPRFK